MKLFKSTPEAAVIGLKLSILRVRLAASELIEVLRQGPFLCVCSTSLKRGKRNKDVHTTDFALSGYIGYLPTTHNDR
jgi:hypothetical protein